MGYILYCNPYYTKLRGITAAIYLFPILTIIIVICLFEFIYAQDDIQVGRLGGDRPSSAGALYDYSSPNAVNFRIQLWGYVRFPKFILMLEKT